MDITTDMNTLKTQNKKTNYWRNILSVLTQCIRRTSSIDTHQLIDNIDNTEDDEEIIYDISGFIASEENTIVD